jgi:hypothetical protein
LGTGIYPKATVLNRFIAKLIDVFLAAAAEQVIASVGFLAGVAYLFVADGLQVVEASGSGSSGFRRCCPRSVNRLDFREYHRNIHTQWPSCSLPFPVGWLASAAIIGFEAI